MLSSPSEHEIVLENEVVRVTISLASGEVAAWTELSTGDSLIVRPIGPKLFLAEGGDALSPDPGGFLATVDGNEALVYDPFGRGGIAVQTLYRLLPGENAMEAEVALTNRTSAAIPLESIFWPGLAASFDTHAFHPLPAAGRDGEESGWSGFPGLALAGRSSLAFRVRFSAFGEFPHTPGSGAESFVGSEPFVGPEAAFALSEAATIRVARPLRGARLFLQTEDGQTLEAPVDADPDRALVLPLGGLRPVGAMLRSADGIDLAPRLDASAPTRRISRAMEPIDWPQLSEEELSSLDFEIGARHLAALERARRATASGEDALAEGYLETALLYNGDDPLTWWAKAGVQRRLDPERERAEWLNARYLRPLEPLVAAEALLAQEPAGPEGENPLMRIVAGREAIAAGCVAAYAEAGSERDAIALGGRILAVRNWRRVRLLMAGLYLTRSRMTMEAAEHWTVAENADSEEVGTPTAFERELHAALDARFGTPA